MANGARSAPWSAGDLSVMRRSSAASRVTGAVRAAVEADRAIEAPSVRARWRGGLMVSLIELAALDWTVPDIRTGLPPERWPSLK